MAARSLKRLLKRKWAEACVRVKAADALLRIRGACAGRSPAAILLYHRVVPRAETSRVASLRQIVLAVETFERQMAFLAARYTVLPLGRLAEARAPLPLRAVAVTFDDGWEDNFRFALPVMRRHGVPATVFLTAGLVGTQRVFWQERLRASALRVADAWRAGVLAESVPLPPAARSAVSARAALDAIDALIEKAKRMAEVERTALLDAVEAAAGGGTGDLYAANRLLTWDEVRAMSAHGVEFGSHGESHAILTRIGAEQLDRELRASRERIERETGRPCTAIAYPNGDYNAAVTAAARKAGYTVGLTVRPGLNMPRTPPFELRRISVADNRFVDETGAFRESMFEAALAGLL